MSVLARFTPVSLTAEQYSECTRRLEEAGDWPAPDGLDIHVCFGTDGDLRISEIWDSPEQLEAFGPKIQPVLEAVGINPGGEPELLEIHKIVRR